MSHADHLFSKEICMSTQVISTVAMESHEAAGSEVVPAAVRSLQRIFAEELAGVGFPDVSADSLTAEIERVRERAVAVAQARATLEGARAALDDAQQRLVNHAERGLAYARVFAEGNDALAEILASLSLTPAVPAPPKKRRGRPPKRAKAEQLALSGEPEDEFSSSSESRAA